MKEKMIGIAKRNIKKDTIMKIPLDRNTGELLHNKYINFIEGTNILDIVVKE